MAQAKPKAKATAKAKKPVAAPIADPNAVNDQPNPTVVRNEQGRWVPKPAPAKAKKSK